MDDDHSYSGSGPESIDHDDDLKPAALPDLDGNDGAESTNSVESDNGGKNNCAVEDDNDSSARPQPPAFSLSGYSQKNGKGQPLCRAMDCERKAATTINVSIGNNTVGLCRIHYNGWLISTGQVDGSWEPPAKKIKTEIDDQGSGGQQATAKNLNDEGGQEQEAKKTPVAATHHPPANNVGGMKSTLTHVPEDSGIEISRKRRTNDKGRTLCKVIGCSKMDQSSSDGFCRMHFNIFSIENNDDGTNGNDQWTCGCGHSMSMKNKRCGKCAKWRGGKREPYDVKVSASIINGGITPDTNPNTSWTCTCGHSMLGKKKRCGKCNKWRQGKRDSYSTSGGVVVDELVYDINIPWTCVCGHSMAGKKKRCGKCKKWRGGNRESYTTSGFDVTSSWTCECGNSISGKKKRCEVCQKWRGETHSYSVTQETEAISNEATDHWTCACGNEVPSTKSRCGKCHHWRGGKRKGGWKLKASNENDNDDGIDWAQDWECCEVAIPAKKARCGKCNGWRGGKRVPKSRREGSQVPPDNDSTSWDAVMDL